MHSLRLRCVRASKQVRGVILSGVMLLAALRCHPGDAGAIKKSQHATVAQRVAHTNITIVYNRPVARGRKLFGALVPFGRPWDPGADQATTLAVSRDVRVNGAVLAAGTYSLWAIPDTGRWTIIFSRAAHTFHIPYPQGKDALRVPATPHPGPYMETLAFYFPSVDSTRAELDLHWGETIVPLTIDAP
jgi:hypothetical protein